MFNSWKSNRFPNSIPAGMSQFLPNVAIRKRKKSYLCLRAGLTRLSSCVKGIDLLSVLFKLPIMTRNITGTLWIFVCLLLLNSCNHGKQENFVEVESKTYIAAKQQIREGDFEQALQFFLKVIENHPYASESHLEAGVIYLQHEDEPILAIYHFNQYLQQRPGSREAPLVEELILSAKKQFASSLPGNPFKNAVSRMELLETIAVLKRQIETINTENIDLKEQNAELHAQLSKARDTMRGIFSVDESDSASDSTENTTVRTRPIVLNQAEQASVQSMLPDASNQRQIPETYQVRPGDSLYAISMNFYGDAEHIQAIFQANRSILQSVNDLRPGQILTLPL